AQVAERWPEKAVVVPCFHDEPSARLGCWQPLFDRVAGLLYHSPEEQALAERVLGINHPAGSVVGTHLDIRPGDADRGRALAGPPPFVFSWGRPAEGKTLPLLLDPARRFAAEHPARVRFVFIGHGEVAVPREPWALNLGRVPADARRDLLAGAA